MDGIDRDLIVRRLREQHGPMVTALAAMLDLSRLRWEGGLALSADGEDSRSCGRETARLTRFAMRACKKRWTLMKRNVLREGVGDGDGVRDGVGMDGRVNG
jgi:hypothetical protein